MEPDPAKLVPDDLNCSRCMVTSQCDVVSSGRGPLPVKLRPPVGKHIVQRIDLLIVGFQGIDPDKPRARLYFRSGEQDAAVIGGDLAAAGEEKIVFAPLFPAYAVCSYGKDAIFQAPGCHGLLAIRKDQV